MIPKPCLLQIFIPTTLLFPSALSLSTSLSLSFSKLHTKHESGQQLGPEAAPATETKLSGSVFKIDGGNVPQPRLSICCVTGNKSAAPRCL